MRRVGLRTARSPRSRPLAGWGRSPAGPPGRDRRCRHVLWLLAFLWLWASVTPETAAMPAPYRALRYRGVVGQTDWSTCGPAAVATLLSHYYGLPATEGEVLALAVEAMAARGREPAGGITLLALRQALAEKGVPSRGYRVDAAALARYFAQGGLPLLLHVTRPQLHYVLAVAMVDELVVLADPSFGLRVLPLPALYREKGFDGVVLLPMPPEELAARARARQAKTAAEVRARLSLLFRLRERLLG